MARSRITIAIIALATVLSGTAPAVARIHLGPLGPLGFMFSHLLPRGRLHHHHFPGHRRSASVRDAARAPRHGEDLRSGRYEDPTARVRIAAAAALAGWHGGHGTEGWWRHGDGGYGWVGPLFWPFAYFDIYGYAISDDNVGFQNYGYPDIFAAVFAPYGSRDLDAYLAQRRSGRRRGDAVPLAELCGNPTAEVAGLPVDQIKTAIQPTDAQRAALDQLTKGSVKAAQTLAAACPTQTALTAPGRLAAMEQRLQAMVAAVELVRPPLEDLYRKLDDAQKARFNALADDQRKASEKTAPADRCDAETAAEPPWPADEIESTLHPLETQRAALKELQHAGTRAAAILKAACQENGSASDAATPVARLESVDRRLDAMLQAVRVVQSALGDAYDMLSDEQRAQFETIGPKRAAS